MQTARLYYDDCYTSLFKAQLVEFRLETRSAYLDATFFYPTSGGQPHDIGNLNGVPVEDVIDEGDRIAHVLSANAAQDFPLNGTVKGQLDWPRRCDHMQQHTGQHLLSAVFLELFGFKTLSFHMGEDVSTIELATGQLDDFQIESVERRANVLVSEARPVRITNEDASEAGGLRKASARSGLLRIITIEAYDRSACGGTHVQNTAEIGPIQIRSLDRVRGNIRLQFVCGGRALRHSRQDFRLLARLAKGASVAPPALEEYVSALRLRLENAGKEITRVSLELAKEQAKRLHGETTASEDGLKRVSLVSELTDSTRLLALAFAALPKSVIAVVPQTLPGTILLACSVDSGLNLGNVWKATFASGGAKGGGSATFAQGSVSDPEALAKIRESLRIPAGI